MKTTRRKPTQSALVHAEPTNIESGTGNLPATASDADFDRDLLDRARTQWQLGDWASLRALPIAKLNNHPERARLALLAASGHLQVCALEETRALVTRALEWGCNHRVVAQVLVAGVHNTLGRAACVAGDEERARRHFDSSVAVVNPSTDVRLLGHARAVREMVDLGMLPEAATKIAQHVQDHRQGEAARLSRAHQKVLDLEVDLLRARVDQIQKQVYASGKVPTILKAPNGSPAPRTPEPPGPDRRYFGLNGLDRKLEAYIDFDDGYFVELGANDGVAQSNTLYFEKHRGWRGVLIEPILHNFLKCRQNRAPENHFECAACVSDAYEQPFVTLAYSNLMTAPIGLDSDIEDPRAHAQSGRVYIPKDECVVDVLARARTLSSILDDAGAPAWIDLLSLDVEGAEMEVLRGVDHRRHRFRHIVVECRAPERLTAYLTEHGYHLVDKLSVHDYLFGAR